MKTSACRDGTLKNQAHKMGLTPQHFHTSSTSCLLLVCVYRRAVEGTGLDSALGCVVHVDVHGE